MNRRSRTVVAGIVAAITLGLNDATMTQELRRNEAKEENSGMDAASRNSGSSDSGLERYPVSRHFWLWDRAKDFAGDQRDLWTSPRELRSSDTAWLVPTTGLAAGLFLTDSDTGKHLNHNPRTLSHYKTLSNAGAVGLAGGAALLWVTSFKNHDAHRRETGVLAGEAAINGLVMAEAAKYAFRRDRPIEGDHTGTFFSRGKSFPSEHAAGAWAVASVVAHEYPGVLTKLLAYGAAGIVSYSRVKSGEHFPSDVVIGGLIGELSAYTVYRRHHDPELAGEEWVSWSTKAKQLFSEARPGYQGSPYVPLDSWIYPALDRLAGMGVIDSEFAAMRPWTRRECARLVTEAGERISQANPAVEEVYLQLTKEFAPELDPSETGPRFRAESIYTNIGHISGAPLEDGYHFAETIINNFGRPFGEGWSTSNGFSVYTTTGPWTGYFRGELQTAPAIPPLPLSARQFIETADNLTGVPPATGTPTIRRFQILDAYVGLTLADWQISFGQQSLNWGPGEGGSIMFDDNAAPIEMIRINRVTPMTVPGLSRIFGPLRVEAFFGQIGGHHFAAEPNFQTVGSFAFEYQPQPFLHGQRFSFKPTRNFEFGFSRTAIIGGPGVPLTLHTFKDSFLNAGNGLPGSLDDNGDQRSGLDWSYRLPKLRNWVTFYGDAFAEDEFSPIAYWDRSAIRSGLYFSHLPKLPRLDLRVEGVYTDLPTGGRMSHGFFYFNFRFKEGYTNDGQLLGSWIGREGQGAQAWANYWLGSRNRVQLNFRHQKVSQQFVPGGGTLTDFGVRSDYWLTQTLGVTSAIQFERWLFPVIQSGVQHNVSVSAGVQIQPQKLIRPMWHRGERKSAAQANQP